MRSQLILAVIFTCGWVHTAQALELSYVSVTTGFLGSKRVQTKFLPGDSIHVNFEIKDLKVDPKSGTCLYQTRMQIYDKFNKEIFDQYVPIKKLVLIGGNAVPAFATAVIGSEQDSGEYRIKLTVHDFRAKAEKSLVHKFEVLPASFGIVRPVTPAVAFAGTDFAATVSIVGMKRDEKDKLPRTTVTFQVKDQLGKTLLPEPVKLDVRIMHDPVLNDLTKLDVIGVQFPLFLNKPGQFTFHIEAHDEISKLRRTMQFPIKVLDGKKLTGG